MAGANATTLSRRLCLCRLDRFCPVAVMDCIRTPIPLRAWKTPTVCISRQVVPGALVRLAADWAKLRASEEVIVSRLDGPGLVVCPRNSREELWIPASLVRDSSFSRAWSFRPRKPDRAGESEDNDGRSNDGSDLVSIERAQGEERGPASVAAILSSIRTTVGGTARLTAETHRAEGASVGWRRLPEDRDVLAHGEERYRLHRSSGLVSLEISRCRPSDSGVYQCRLERDGASSSTNVSLCVSGGGGGSTWARPVGRSKVEVDWERRRDTDYGPYSLECRTIPSQSWVRILEEVQEPPVVVSLPAGSSYSFRAIGGDGSVGSPSEVVRLSIREECAGGPPKGWEAEQFVGRYLELEELGVGRFGTVRRARDRGTGQEVALKQTSRRKQSRSLTRAEYELLATGRHCNIVRAFALFENAPRPGVDTIVLEMVNGSSLFDHLSAKKEDYTEAMAAKYTGQLLSGLGWLHGRGKAHLDLKPENVLVDRQTGIVKLVDLGEAVRAPIDEVVPPADLEFAPPELVLGRPTGSYTDMWAAGVFIYVLLSGLSPFLDDSLEETTANILKCDFCFPEEYFGSISDHAKDLLGKLLCLRIEDRIGADACLTSSWFKVSPGGTVPSSRMAAFIERRAHCAKSRQDRNGDAYP